MKNVEKTNKQEFNKHKKQYISLNKSQLRSDKPYYHLGYIKYHWKISEYVLNILNYSIFLENKYGWSSYI